MTPETLTITLRVPGSVYLLAFDPLATDWAREHGLAPMCVKRVGRGYVYEYEVTPDEALDMIETAECLADTWQFGCGPEGTRDSATLRKWTRRAREVVS